MFRYIAIAWNDTEPSSASMARDLGKAWQTREHWNAALLRTGLQIFTTGTKTGVNDVCLLEGDSGLVLGALFRRGTIGSSSAKVAKLSSIESDSIRQSGGRSLVTEFWGRYVAFLQTSSGTTSVLRDPSGTLPCFLIDHQGVTIIFSWLEDAMQMLGPLVPWQVNWDALAAQLLHGLQGGRATTLTAVSQLLPGQRLDLQGRSEVLLWSAVHIAGTPADCEVTEAVQLVRDAVQSCTRTWASCYDTLLLRLSGGVDSSIVLSCLAPGSTTSDVIGINYHSPGSDSDERHYARLTAARVGRDLVERERDPGFRIDRVLNIARMPDPVPYIGWMNAAMDARLASAYGAQALFTGAGGDAVFYEFPRWWPAADYLHHKGINTGFAAAAMDAARLGKLSVWRTMALAVRQRLGLHQTPLGSNGFGDLLTAELLADNADHRRFSHPALGKTHGLPVGKYMQTLALMYPLGYYDPFEQDAAPELVNPLLSQPLVELCLRLPTYLLAHGGHGRALARRAFASDLPPQITNRRSKGGMEEHIKAVLQSNIELVRSLLLDGQLARRGMLDRLKVEELLSGRPTALAGPVSQIHALTAIEAWLARWPG